MSVDGVMGILWQAYCRDDGSVEGDEEDGCADCRHEKQEGKRSWIRRYPAIGHAIGGGMLVAFYYV